MKLHRTKTGTYTIEGITATQYRALAAVLTTVNERCFDEQDEDGNYYSNDDFVCSLDGYEREALRQVCDALRKRVKY